MGAVSWGSGTHSLVSAAPATAATACVLLVLVETACLRLEEETTALAYSLRRVRSESRLQAPTIPQVFLTETLWLRAIYSFRVPTARNISMLLRWRRLSREL